MNDEMHALFGVGQIGPALAALLQAAPSPVVALNRAVAGGMAYGATAGLARVDALRDAAELAGYHLLPAVRGDLLEKLGRHAEGRAEFGRAATLAANARERALLQARATGSPGPQSVRHAPG